MSSSISHDERAALPDGEGSKARRRGDVSEPWSRRARTRWAAVCAADIFADIPRYGPYGSPSLVRDPGDGRSDARAERSSTHLK